MKTKEVVAIAFMTGHRKTFGSVSDCAAHYEINPSYMRRIIKEGKQFRGAVFEYTGKEGEQKLRVNSKVITAVSEQENTEKKTFVYKSAAEAARDFGVRYTEIMYAAKNNSSFLGYKFGLQEVFSEKPTKIRASRKQRNTGNEEVSERKSSSERLEYN